MKSIKKMLLESTHESKVELNEQDVRTLGALLSAVEEVKSTVLNEMMRIGDGDGYCKPNGERYTKQECWQLIKELENNVFGN